MLLERSVFLRKGCFSFFQEILQKYPFFYTDIDKQFDILYIITNDIHYTHSVYISLPLNESS